MTAWESPNNLKKGPHGVFDELTETALEQAIRKAVPVDDMQIDFIGNEPVFVLCQYLKGVDVPENTKFNDLKPFVKDWHELSKDKLVDKDDDQLTFADVWSMLVEVWGKVKYAKGSALEAAQARAEKATYSIPELDCFDDEGTLLLARVCYELSRPDGDFFLSTYDAGNILGKCQKTGRNRLKMFEAEKIIERVKVGHTGIASEYRYVGKPVLLTRPADEFELIRQQKIEEVRHAEKQDKSSEDK